MPPCFESQAMIDTALIRRNCRTTREDSSCASPVSMISHSDYSDIDDDCSLSDQADEFKPTMRPFHGFLNQLAIAVFVIGTNACLLFGSLWFPTTMGLYLLLPYYIFTTCISTPEYTGNWRWGLFAERFTTIVNLRKYLGLQLHMNETLAEEQAAENSQFVFAIHPHGANADYIGLLNGMLCHYLPNIASRTRTLVATVLFRIPLVREMALWAGCVDARRSVADRLLQTNHSLCVLPGGQAEQIRTMYGRERVYLTQRKGFIRLALTHGVPVVPVYAFGVADYYRTSMYAYEFRLWMVKALGISIPFAQGQYGTLISPLQVPTTVVFGEPLHFDVAVEGAPSDEEVSKAHSLYIEALIRLFDSNKVALGYGDRTLEII